MNTRHLKKISLLLLLTSSPFLWSQETNVETTEDGEANSEVEAYSIELPELPATTKNAIEAYNDCLQGVLSGLESSSIKREKITSDCESQQSAMALEFPEAVRELLIENAERRITNVLDALEALEPAIDYAVEETRIITQAMLDEELTALAEQPTIEVSEETSERSSTQDNDAVDTQDGQDNSTEG